MRVKIILAFLLLLNLCNAQESKTTNSYGYKITYLKYSNGKLIENQDQVVVFTNEKETLLSSENIQSKKSNYPFEKTRINRADNSFMQLAYLNAKSTAATVDNNSILKQNFEFVNETKVILGYVCKKAKTVVNSNSIELWYTDQLGVKGAPSILGQSLGLVLETVRNGNSAVTATKIEKLKKEQSLFISNEFISSPKTDALSYRDLLWKSRFKTIKVFFTSSASCIWSSGAS